MKMWHWLVLGVVAFIYLKAKGGLAGLVSSVSSGAKSLAGGASSGSGDVLPPGYVRQPDGSAVPTAEAQTKAKAQFAADSAAWEQKNAAIVSNSGGRLSAPGLSRPGAVTAGIFGHGVNDGSLRPIPAPSSGGSKGALADIGSAITGALKKNKSAIGTTVGGAIGTGIGGPGAGTALGGALGSFAAGRVGG